MSEELIKEIIVDNFKKTETYWMLREAVASESQDEIMDEIVGFVNKVIEEIDRFNNLEIE